jgi:hypothetical protein
MTSSGSYTLEGTAGQHAPDFIRGIVRAIEKWAKKWTCPCDFETSKSGAFDF